MGAVSCKRNGNKSNFVKVYIEVRINVIILHRKVLFFKVESRKQKDNNFECGTNLKTVKGDVTVKYFRKD